MRPSSFTIPAARTQPIKGLALIREHRPDLVVSDVQMPGTMAPLFFFPHDTFARVPYAPTLEGQYIIKNLVLIGAAIIVGRYS